MSNLQYTIEIKSDKMDLLTKLNAEILALKEAQSNLKKSNQEGNEEWQRNAAELKKTQTEYSNAQKEIQKTDQATKFQSGSMKELSFQLAQNKDAYRNLSAEERNNADVGGKLLKTISSQDAEIKKLDASIGNHQRNVGNYTQGMKEALQQSGLFSRELGMLSQVQAALASIGKLFAMSINETTIAENINTTAVETNTIASEANIVATEANIVSTKAQIVANEGAAVSTGIFTKSLNILKTALISTGIGALLVALGSLVAYFTSTEEGAARLQKILSPLKIIFGNIKDVLADFGEIILDVFSKPKESIKALGEFIKSQIINRIEAFGIAGKAIVKIFTGEWKEGFSELGKAWGQGLTGIENVGNKIVGIGDKINEKFKENSKEIKSANDLIEAKLQLQKYEREAQIQIAKNEEQIAKNKLNAADKTKHSDAERIAALKEALKLEDENLVIREKIAEKKFEEIKLENSFSKTNEEGLKKEAEAEASLYNIRANSYQARVRMTGKLTSLEQEILKDKETETEKELKQKDEIEKANEKLRDQIEKINIEIFDDKLAKINAEQEAERKAIEDSIASNELKEQAIIATNAKYQKQREDLLNDGLAKYQKVLDDEFASFEAQAAKEIEIEFANQEKKDEANENLRQKMLDIQAELSDNETLQIENQRQKEILAINESVADAELKRQTIAAINQKYDKEQKKIDDAARKKDLKNMADMFGQASELFKEHTVAYKALAIAQATINTYLAASAAFAAMSSIPPAPLWGIIAAATAVTQGLMTVAEITNVKFAKGGKIEGASHAQGGVNINAEGGEVVINKNSAREFMPVLDYINQWGGGRPLTGISHTAAMGGLVPKVAGSLGQSVTVNTLNEAQIQDIVTKTVTGLKIYLPVTEVNKIQKRVQVIETISSL